MVYEGLREGLRAAVGVEVRRWKELATDELVLGIYRNNVELMKLRYTSVLLALLPEYQVSHEVSSNVNQIIDDALNGVDWDTFFEIPKTQDIREYLRQELERRFNAFLDGKFEEFLYGISEEEVRRNWMQEGDQKSKQMGDDQSAC